MTRTGPRPRAVTDPVITMAVGVAFAAPPLTPELPTSYACSLRQAQRSGIARMIRWCG